MLLAPSQPTTKRAETRRAVGAGDDDVVVALFDAGDLDTAAHVDAELARPAVEQLLERRAG